MPMLPMEFHVNSPQELAALARNIIAAYPGRRVFALDGPMGAGKTTFIKAFCLALGVSDMVCSPTFAIINVYSGGDTEPVYHFDLYRLKSPGELIATGAAEYFESGAYCFVEWPELAAPFLPENTLSIQLAVTGDKKRHICIKL